MPPLPQQNRGVFSLCLCLSDQMFRLVVFPMLLAMISMFILLTFLVLLEEEQFFLPGTEAILKPRTIVQLERRHRSISHVESGLEDSAIRTFTQEFPEIRHPDALSGLFYSKLNAWRAKGSDESRKASSSKEDSTKKINVQDTKPDTSSYWRYPDVYSLFRINVPDSSVRALVISKLGENNNTVANITYAIPPFDQWREYDMSIAPILGRVSAQCSDNVTASATDSAPRWEEMRNASLPGRAIRSVNWYNDDVVSFAFSKGGSPQGNGNQWSFALGDHTLELPPQMGIVTASAIFQGSFLVYSSFGDDCLFQVAALPGRDSDLTAEQHSLLAAKTPPAPLPATGYTSVECIVALSEDTLLLVIGAVLPSRHLSFDIVRVVYSSESQTWEIIPVEKSLHTTTISHQDGIFEPLSLYCQAYAVPSGKTALILLLDVLVTVDFSLHTDGYVSLHQALPSSSHMDSLLGRSGPKTSSSPRMLAVSEKADLLLLQDVVLQRVAPIDRDDIRMAVDNGELDSFMPGGPPASEDLYSLWWTSFRLPELTSPSGKTLHILAANFAKVCDEELLWVLYESGVVAVFGFELEDLAEPAWWDVIMEWRLWLLAGMLLGFQLWRIRVRNPFLVLFRGIWGFLMVFQMLWRFFWRQ